MALYDRIGKGYDETRRPDARIVERLALHLFGRSGEPCPASAGRYLDVACGTGNYTLALAAHGGRWAGIDASSRMLDVARGRSTDIEWRHAPAEALPFADGTFDGLLCVLAVHHFEDLPTAFREARRVLAAGPFVLFCCTAERTERFWLRHYFPAMFQRMAEREPSEAGIVGPLRKAGFGRIVAEAYHVPADVEDRFLFCGKYRPELYFDPAIRAGISSFANLCEPEELEAGLTRLREDLDAGRTPRPDPDGDEAPGDYLLLVASD